MLLTQDMTKRYLKNFEWVKTEKYINLKYVKVEMGRSVLFWSRPQYDQVLLRSHGVCDDSTYALRIKTLNLLLKEFIYCSFKEVSWNSEILQLCIFSQKYFQTEKRSSRLCCVIVVVVTKDNNNKYSFILSTHNFFPLY